MREKSRESVVAFVVIEGMSYLVYNDDILEWVSQVYEQIKIEQGIKVVIHTFFSFVFLYLCKLFYNRT